MAGIDLGAALAHVKSQKLSLETPGKLKKDLEEWLGSQSPAVDAAGHLLLGAAQGAALGAVMGSLSSGKAAAAAQQGGPAALQQAGGGMLRQARNFAVMSGVNSGVGVYARRRRGVEDVYNSLASAFASGAAFSLVGQLGAPPPAPGTAARSPLVSAVSGGAMFAVFQGGFYKLSEKIKGGKGGRVAAGVPDRYSRVSGLLRHLDLGKYEKNLRGALLEDRTIALWDSEALRDAKVPPGPRLVILEHVNQYRDVLAGGSDPVADALSPALPLVDDAASVSGPDRELKKGWFK